MATDPLFAPLATQFRAGMVRAIIRQLATTGLIPRDFDPEDDRIIDAVYDIAFFVFVQLEELGGLRHEGEVYFSHLVFTPKGAAPDESPRLISQMGRTFLHGGLTGDEVHAALVALAAERDS